MSFGLPGTYDALIFKLTEVAPSVDVWRIDLDGLAAAANPQELSAHERARAARLRFELDRRRFIAAHVGLRNVLAAHLGRAARSLEFHENEFGKPSLADAPQCRFNLSHSEGIALVAVSAAHEVGVDVEAGRDLSGIDALARTCCTADELHALNALTENQRPQAFLRLWTRKEACLKALGIGLSGGLQSIEVGVAGPGVCEAAARITAGKGATLTLWSVPAAIDESIAAALAII